MYEEQSKPKTSNAFSSPRMTARVTAYDHKTEEEVGANGASVLVRCAVWLRSHQKVGGTIATLPKSKPP